TQDDEVAHQRHASQRRRGNTKLAQALKTILHCATCNERASNEAAAGRASGQRRRSLHELPVLTRYCHTLDEYRQALANQHKALAEIAACKGPGRSTQSQRNNFPTDEGGIRVELHACLKQARCTIVYQRFLRQPFEPRALADAQVVELPLQAPITASTV